MRGHNYCDDRHDGATDVVSEAAFGAGGVVFDFFAHNCYRH